MGAKHSLWAYLACYVRWPMVLQRVYQMPAPHSPQAPLAPPRLPGGCVRCQGRRKVRWWANERLLITCPVCKDEVLPLPPSPVALSPNALDEKARQLRQDIRALEGQRVELERQLTAARQGAVRPGTIGELKRQLVKVSATLEVKNRYLQQLLTPRLPLT